MKRKLLFSLIISAVLFFASFSYADDISAKPVIECCNIYADIELDAWYHDGVHFCILNEFMNGKGSGKFYPKANITRAELVSILWKMSGRPEAKTASAFIDVPANKWCAGQIAWASEASVVRGYGDVFYPDRAITREEFALILYNYAKSLGEANEDVKAFELEYKDRSNIHSWADEAVRWCSMKDILKGKENGIFDPRGTASRAEAATMIKRFCNREK